MSDGGKGSARRPGENYQQGWDRIFGRKQQHSFRHDGHGSYSCMVCGKNEKYAHHGETCPGNPKESKR